MAGISCRWFVRFGVAVLHTEGHALERAVILIAFVPWPRWKYADRMLTIGNIPELEFVIKIIERFIRLIVEDHVDMVPRVSSFVHPWFIAFQIASEFEL